MGAHERGAMATFQVIKLKGSPLFLSKTLIRATIAYVGRETGTNKLLLIFLIEVVQHSHCFVFQLTSFSSLAVMNKVKDHQI